MDPAGRGRPGPARHARLGRRQDRGWPRPAVPRAPKAEQEKSRRRPPRLEREPVHTLARPAEGPGLQAPRPAGHEPDQVSLPAPSSAVGGREGLTAPALWEQGPAAGDASGRPASFSVRRAGDRGHEGRPRRDHGHAPPGSQASGCTREGAGVAAAPARAARGGARAGEGDGCLEGLRARGQGPRSPVAQRPLGPPPAFRPPTARGLCGGSGCTAAVGDAGVPGTAGAPAEAPGPRPVPAAVFVPTTPRSPLASASSANCLVFHLWQGRKSDHEREFSFFFFN